MSRRYNAGIITASFDPLAVHGDAVALYVWGAQSEGILGNNVGYPAPIGTITSPITVGTNTDWLNASGEYRHMVAAKQNGTLWTWGKQDGGEFGLNFAGTARSSPVQVGTLTGWSSKISSTFRRTFAIKTDGTLWAWGGGGNGALGDGTAVAKSSPVQIGSGTDWYMVKGSRYASGAIKTDGTLWMWGFGNYGALGNGAQANKSSPTQVGSLTTWSSLATGRLHTLAIKTDGTMWSWGANYQGQLGTNDRGDGRSSPVQVGVDTNWSKISTVHRTCAAVRTNGTLWTWGENTQGKLGLSLDYLVYRSSPVQVGSLTNWSNVFMGEVGAMAVKTDGTLWSWGFGSTIGDDVGNNRSSPVQIGSETNWSSDIMSKGQNFGISGRTTPF